MAQEEQTEYLDSFLKSCKKRHAQYIRRVDKNGLGRFMATTVSIYGDTVFIGEYSDPNCTTPHGRFAYFHETGEVESRGYYSGGRKVGTWRHFKADGTPKPSVKYAMDVPKDMVAAEKKEIADLKAEEEAERMDGGYMADPKALAAAEAAMKAAQEAESEALSADTGGKPVSIDRYQAGTVGSGVTSNSNKGSSADSSSKQQLEQAGYSNRPMPQFYRSYSKAGILKLTNYGLPMVW